MTKEKLILLTSWLVLIVLLLWLVPEDKIRHALVIFLFKQSITWLLGLAIVERNYLAYPVRLFPRASKSSFTFEFFAYPAICVFFNLYYPYGENLTRQLLHYIYFTAGITAFEFILEMNTNLISYITWKWYWTFISLFITLMLSNLFYQWFFNF